MLESNVQCRISVKDDEVSLWPQKLFLRALCDIARRSIAAGFTTFKNLTHIRKLLSAYISMQNIPRISTPLALNGVRCKL